MAENVKLVLPQLEPHRGPVISLPFVDTIYVKQCWRIDSRGPTDLVPLTDPS